MSEVTEENSDGRSKIYDHGWSKTYIGTEENDSGCEDQTGGIASRGEKERKLPFYYEMSKAQLDMWYSLIYSQNLISINILLENLLKLWSLWKVLS